MVFSQTSHKARSILKVVEIDHLKSNKKQENGITGGVIAGGSKETMPSSPAPTTSYSEEFLKPEPAFESMYHETDCGFFQDLEQLYSDPAKGEQTQIIDSHITTKERANDNDTSRLPLSPQDWESFDYNSPAQASMYGISSHSALSPMPMADEFLQLDALLDQQKVVDHRDVQYQEQFLDFNNMPVVLGDLQSEKMADVNNVQVVEPSSWSPLPPADEYNKQYTNTHDTMPFIDQDDSMDSKFVTVIPGEIENNDLIVNRFIFGTENVDKVKPEEEKRPGLKVNIPQRAPSWGDNNDMISTPDIVTYVEQLEKEKYSLLVDNALPSQWQAEESTELLPTIIPTIKTSPLVDYEPITPKSESQAESENEDKSFTSSRKRRRNSEDSDETYTPEVEYTPRSYTKRKPRKNNIPIKEMILQLEGSQQLKKARRGRPPKVRRESTISQCSIDDSTSNVSTQEVKYRELRDKNNEASKRSRMNRKLKELQMEQLALDLEERNKKLQVKVDILEEMTKKLKDALMTAILHK